MVQFGDAKPFLPAFIWSSLLALFITFGVCSYRAINYQKAFTLFFGLLGTFLLASAFSPQGQLPPQGNIGKRIKWFFQPQRAIPLNYNRPAYYIALICIGLSFIINVL